MNNLLLLYPKGCTAPFIHKMTELSEIVNLQIEISSFILMLTYNVRQNPFNTFCKNTAGIKLLMNK